MSFFVTLSLLIQFMQILLELFHLLPLLIWMNENYIETIVLLEVYLIYNQITNFLI